MARKMIILSDSESTVLEEVLARDEEQLQERLKANPGLLPIEDFDMTGPLMVIGRETSLPSGSVDLVGISRGGHLLIIEFKTGPQNPDFRGSFAQLIDYGSDLWGMSYEVFESTVPLRYFSSDRCPTMSPVRGKASLNDAARGTWPDLSDEELARFIEQITHQLNTGGFHYVLVAQRFTLTTEQTVRYLNSAMQAARFYAVELVRFTGADVTAFEARTVLKPERAVGSKAAVGSIDESRFLEGILDDTYREALRELLEACRGLGLRFEWGTVGTSIRLPTTDRSEPLTIAWLFPSGGSGWMGLSNLNFGYDPSSAEKTPSVRAALDVYVDAVERLDGTTSVKPQWLRARELPPHAVRKNLRQMVEILAELVRAVSATS
jgi:hypothetical protein